MPQSLIFSLETQSTVLSKHLQGHAPQQLFFNLVDTVDPALGHLLRRDKRNCSYALSSLQPGPFLETSNSLQYTHTQALEAHTPCWWRISFLDDALFEHLFFLWSQLADETFPLGAASVKIKRTFFESPSIDWASSCSYRDLYEQASSQERDIHLQFITPAAFDHDNVITPLPTAEAVFQPLRKCWNRYSGLVFAPSLTRGIIPIHFKIQTQPVQTVLRNSFQTITGCTGQISFRIGGDGDPLTVKRVNALASFTKYCGVGINTRLGMGVVKRLPLLNSSLSEPTYRQPQLSVVTNSPVEPPANVYQHSKAHW